MRIVNAHVVRNNVDQQSHSVLLQRLGQALKVLFIAEPRIQLLMVDHIVAVGAALPGPKKRRQVRGTNAQSRQIADKLARILEPHLRA